MLETHFEDLKMEEHESVADFSSKLSLLAKETLTLGKKYKENKPVVEMINSWSIAISLSIFSLYVRVSFFFSPLSFSLVSLSSLLLWSRIVFGRVVLQLRSGLQYGASAFLSRHSVTCVRSS